MSLGTDLVCSLTFVTVPATQHPFPCLFPHDPFLSFPSLFELWLSFFLSNSRDFAKSKMWLAAARVRHGGRGGWAGWPHPNNPQLWKCWMQELDPNVVAQAHVHKERIKELNTLFLYPDQDRVIFRNHNKEGVAGPSCLLAVLYHCE